MFKFVTHTWHPIIGCLHGCSYCWAKDLVEKRLRHHGGKYKDGFFKPKLVESELTGDFNVKDAIIGVSIIAEMWGKWVPREWILRVLEKCKEADPSVWFLYQTKNPARYWEFLEELPYNSYLGVTIETNRNYHVTKAPPPEERYRRTIHLPKLRFLSIEPVMDFDLPIMLKWIDKISPITIEIGADNYGHNLPEPEWSKIQQLKQGCWELGFRVIEKDGLSRLREE